MSLRRARSVCTPQTHSEPGTIAPAPDPLNGAGAIGEGADSVPKPSAHNPPAGRRLGPHGVGVVVLVIHRASVRLGATAAVPTKRLNTSAPVSQRLQDSRADSSWWRQSRVCPYSSGCFTT